MSKATVGRIVLYSLSGQDADEINRRRTTPVSVAQRISSGLWPLGAQAHVGNPVQKGDIFPMIIVAVWGPECVNGQVFLDGTDTLWAMSRSLGTLTGTWAWPVRS